MCARRTAAKGNGVTHSAVHNSREFATDNAKLYSGGIYTHNNIIYAT